MSTLHCLKQLRVFLQTQKEAGNKIFWKGFTYFMVAHVFETTKQLSQRLVGAISFGHLIMKMLTRGVLAIAILIAVINEIFGFEASRSVPMQMDLAASKHITICTGLKRNIACQDGSNIAITYAFWGRTSDKICPSDDGDPVTDCEGADETIGLVRNYCEAKDECQLEARHNKLQMNGTHHCPGVNKYLIVNYNCIPESSEVLLCDSEATTLECQAGWVMEVAGVFWGRRASGKQCGTDEGMECDSSDYASKYLKRKCMDKQKCDIVASSEVLDDKKGPCAGMLKYLRISYVCRPKKRISQNGDDDSESAVDSKLLTDTSSKELMGLLEKHLNEIKTPEVSFKESKSDDRKSEKQYSGVKLSKGLASSRLAGKVKSRETLSRLTQPFYATEDDDLGNTLLSGPAFTRTIGSDKPRDDATQKSIENEAEGKSQIDVVSTENSQKKDQLNNPTRESESIHRQNAEEETPAADLKETASAKRSQEAIPSGIAAGPALKDTVPTANDSDQYELSEPQTVKSILARAKEVLKTLDNDSEDSKDVNKKSGIAGKPGGSLKDEVEKGATNSGKAISKSSLPSNKISSARIQEAARSSVVQPKPGQQKIGLRATGPGVAGVGNTP